MRRTALLLANLLPLALAHAQATNPAAGWKIEMRQVRMPVANGDCGPIELVVLDASGKPPITPDGKQLHWQDFEFALTDSAGAFKLAGSGNILCASAPGATGVVTAKYPESGYLDSPNGKGRTGKQLIPGATASGTLQVHSAGSAPASSQIISATTLPAISPAPPPTQVIGTATPAPGTEPTLISGTLSPPHIALVGFAGAGWWGRPPPVITLAGFTGTGWWGLPPPQIRLRAISGVGEFAPPP
jgi:hypothetical protein